tara:strand:- start:3846 stop:4097 length:252 start_codon:yes stop_codon:yes gene_type:complete
MSQTELDEEKSQKRGGQEQLIQLYDGLAEVVALNNFLYDAFISIACEEHVGIEPNTTIGLSVICRWLKQRQTGLKERLKTLTE